MVERSSHVILLSFKVSVQAKQKGDIARRSKSTKEQPMCNAHKVGKLLHGSFKAYLIIGHVQKALFKSTSNVNHISNQTQNMNKSYEI